MGALLFKFKDNVKNECPFNLIRHSGRKLAQQLHMHDYVQIAYVMQGACMHCYDNRSLTMRTGDLFIIPPHAEHSLNAIPDKEVELILLDIAPAFIDRHMQAFQQSVFHNLSGDAAPTPSVSRCIRLSQDKKSLADYLLYDILEELKEKQEGYAASIQVTLNKLLILVDREFRKLERDGEGHVMPGHYQEQLSEVIRYVNENYDQDIPLHKAAEIAKMTPSYFSHLFKKETGRSFVEFIHEVRIERAMQMIRQNRHSMTNICFQVGFHNVSHFTRTFKRRTGFAPTEYKKSLPPVTKNNSIPI